MCISCIQKGARFHLIVHYSMYMRAFHILCTYSVYFILFFCLIFLLYLFWLTESFCGFTFSSNLLCTQWFLICSMHSLHSFFFLTILYSRLKPYYFIILDLNRWFIIIISFVNRMTICICLWIIENSNFD